MKKILHSQVLQSRRVKQPKIMGHFEEFYWVCPTTGLIRLIQGQARAVNSLINVVMSLRCRAGDNTTDGGNDKKGTLAQVIVGQT